MKAPDFWYQKDTTISKALNPLSRLYAAFDQKNRTQSNPKNLPVPVLCVGNIVSGGSGKTPVAIALLKILQDEQITLSPFFLTRGYRGKIEGPERVDDSNDPDLWGDEALLLSRYASTIVSKNRCKGGELAVNMSADLIIMDDGLQNYTLAKTLSFCVIDGRRGLGNARVIPAGPLRQTLQDGFSLSDAFILIGEDKTDLRGKLPTDKPIFTARLQVKQNEIPAKDSDYIAFCGIGFPEKFRDTLDANGFKILSFHAFPDHYNYTIDDFKKLFKEAKTQNAKLLTTEKDFARLPDFMQKDLIKVLPVEIIFDDNLSVTTFIKVRLNK